MKIGKPIFGKIDKTYKKCEQAINANNHPAHPFFMACMMHIIKTYVSNNESHLVYVQPLRKMCDFAVERLKTKWQHRR